MTDGDQVGPYDAADEGAVIARRHTPVRRLAKWFLGGLAALAILAAVAIAFLHTPPGKDWVLDRIAAAAPASGLRIEIGDIDGSLFSQAKLRNVVLKDPEGEFLSFAVVELDWNPLAWFSNRLDIESLIARDGTMGRLPRLRPGDPDNPILPDFDIRIADFKIVDLTLASGIAGTGRQTVGLDAKADIRSGRMMIEATGDLGTSDRFALNLDSQPDRDRFDVKLDYAAPSGGVLAGLLGARNDYRASIDGEGSWARWAGDIRVDRGTARFATLKLVNRSGRYSLKGRLVPQDMFTGIVARALGQSVTIGAVGTFRDRAFTGGLAVGGEGVQGTGSGTIDLGANAFRRFGLKAVVRDPALLAGDVRIMGGQVAATLDGGFRDLTVDHMFRASQVRIGDIALQDLRQSGAARFDGSRWSLPLSATVGAVDTPGEWFDARLKQGRVAGTVMFAGTRLLSDDLRISFPQVAADLSLIGDLAAGDFRVAGPVDMRNLPIDDLGRVDGRARIDWALAKGGRWTLRSAFDARVAAITNPTIANLAGPSIAAGGAVSLGSSTPIDFRAVDIRSQKLAIVLDGQIARGQTTLAGRGRHADFGAFTVEGAIGESGPDAVLVFADPLPAAGLRDVRVAIKPAGNGLAVETRGQSLLGNFAGTLGIDAPDGGQTRITIAALNIWKTAIAGQLTLRDGGADGDLALAGGGLDGTVRLLARDGGQGFIVNLVADRSQFGGTTPVSIASADIDIDGFLKAGQSTVNGNIAAQGISYGALFIGRLAATSTLRNGTGGVTAAIAGRRGSQFDLQLNADIAPDRIAVATRGAYAGKRIVMPRRAIAIRQPGGGWRLGETLLTYGDGAALMAGEFGGGRTAIDLALDDMPLAITDLALADIGLGGTISGRVEYVNAAGRIPTGAARVMVRGLTRSGLVLTSRPVDLALVSRLGVDDLEARAVLREGGEQRGRLQARIGRLPAGGALMNRLRRGDLHAQMRFTGPASALWRLAAVEAFDLTGPVSVAANITGTLDDPQVRGSLASDDLRIRSAVSGTDVRELRVRGSFAGSRLRLTRFSGTTSNGGSGNRQRHCRSSGSWSQRAGAGYSPVRQQRQSPGLQRFARDGERADAHRLQRQWRHHCGAGHHRPCQLETGDRRDIRDFARYRHAGDQSACGHHSGAGPPPAMALSGRCPRPQPGGRGRNGARQRMERGYRAARDHGRSAYRWHGQYGARHLQLCRHPFRTDARAHRFRCECADRSPAGHCRRNHRARTGRDRNGTRQRAVAGTGVLLHALIARGGDSRPPAVWRVHHRSFGNRRAATGHRAGRAAGRGRDRSDQPAAHRDRAGPPAHCRCGPRFGPGHRRRHRQEFRAAGLCRTRNRWPGLQCDAGGIQGDRLAVPAGVGFHHRPRKRGGGSQPGLLGAATLR